MKIAIIDIETTGLDAYSSRVVAIGFKTEEGEQIFCGNNEKELLENFWREVLKYHMLVGWGIGNFDIQFIKIRSLKHGVKVKNINGKIVDMMHLLCDPMKWKSLDSTSQFLDTGLKETLGQKIPELFESQKWDEIKRYLSNDLNLIYKVFEMMRNCGFFDFAQI